MLPILHPILCMYMCAQKKTWEVIKENINTIPESYKSKYYERFLDTLKPPLNDSFPSLCQVRGFSNLDYLARSVFPFQENKIIHIKSSEENV